MRHRKPAIGKGKWSVKDLIWPLWRSVRRFIPPLRQPQKLRQEGISIRVINARYIKPLDQELLCQTALSLKRIITVEENVLMGGFGSAVLELFEQQGVHHVRVKRLALLMSSPPMPRRRN